MAFFDRFESRFGRFAIPGLLQAIAVLQLVTYVLFLLLPPEAKMAYQGFLNLDGEALLRGEVWRLVTYIFIPKSEYAFVVVVGAMFLMWMGRALDEAWGAFRVNVYVLGGLIPQAIAGLMWPGDVTSIWLYSTTLFAMATIYPNEEILLFFVLPVKLKWVAWLAAGTMALMVLGAPALIVVVLLAHLNYLIAFGPDFVRGRLHMAKVAQRRQKYETAKAPEGVSFHQCSVCQKTEVDDPTLDFRVTDEGEEICSVCRKARAVT